MLLIEKHNPWHLLIEKHIRGSTPRGLKKEKGITAFQYPGRRKRKGITAGFARALDPEFSEQYARVCARLCLVLCDNSCPVVSTAGKQLVTRSWTSNVRRETHEHADAPLDIHLVAALGKQLGSDRFIAKS